MPTLTPLDLKAKGIRPTAHRLAVARYVLHTTAHPSADQVWAAVRRHFPALSRATVYNTLELLVEKGLLRRQVLKPGTVVFDPLLEPHHHFIDDKTGSIQDIPAASLRVNLTPGLKNYIVRDVSVVLRGRRR
jgi:Fe2+ or Zn2+ uptake regulation protein